MLLFNKTINLAYACRLVLSPHSLQLHHCQLKIAHHGHYFRHLYGQPVTSFLRGSERCFIVLYKKNNKKKLVGLICFNKGKNPFSLLSCLDQFLTYPQQHLGVDKHFCGLFMFEIQLAVTLPVKLKILKRNHGTEERLLCLVLKLLLSHCISFPLFRTCVRGVRSDKGCKNTPVRSGFRESKGCNISYSGADRLWLIKDRKLRMLHCFRISEKIQEQRCCTR